jgi:hypothetical protein
MVPVPGVSICIGSFSMDSFQQALAWQARSAGSADQPRDG